MMILLVLRYHICYKIVTIVTRRDLCSYVELVTDKDKQDCVRFLSHAWLTPYSQTVDMLEWHAEVHKSPADTGYWFCTLANVSCCGLCSCLAEICASFLVGISASSCS